MKLQFWGVRGSIPAPGPSTNRYGGNTPCVSVIDKSGHLCVIDMGTGIVPLGNALMGKTLEVDADFSAGQGRGSILLSHAHWDHIQGLPFFAPVFIPGNSFEVFGNERSAERVEAVLEGQMNPQFSPIYTLKNLGAEISFEGVSEQQCFAIGKMQVCSMRVPHGETTSLAFQIAEDDRLIVYASDAGYGEDGPSEEILNFYRGADVLIHDATYTPDEQEERRNRGQSSYADAAKVAFDAEVKKLLLFHHDQDRSDDELDQLVAECRGVLDSLGGKDIEVAAAAEGLEIELS